MKPTRRPTLPDYRERRRLLIAETLRDLRLASPLERPALVKAKIQHCRAVIAMYSEREAARMGYPVLLAAIIDTYGEQP